MRNEELMIVIKDLIFHLDKSIQLQNEQAEFYRGLLKRGLIFQKKAYVGNLSTSLISIPKRFAGHIFKVVLIPIEEQDSYMTVLPKRLGKGVSDKLDKGFQTEANIVKDPTRKSLI